MESSANAFYHLWGAVLVFFMQCGFAMLEAGSVRAKNTQNILLKNFLDAALGTLIWWAIGFAFAYGEGGALPNPFIGGRHFFGIDMIEEEDTEGAGYASWFFQWSFAATAATIVSGSVAERCKLGAYLCYTSMLVGLVYPVVVHWVWSTEGWLSAFRSPPLLGSRGMIDFAGSGVVHMVGGGAGLMGAVFLGPRRGRFGTVRTSEQGTTIAIPGHSAILSTLGVFIIWTGWYGFNAASTLCMYKCMGIALRAAVNTTISAAAGGCFTLFVHVFIFRRPAELAPLMNGVLGGLVSITAGCAVYEPWAAFVIGCIAGLVYIGSSLALLNLEIDDPLDAAIAAPVHFFCGSWGVIAVGLFASPSATMAAYPIAEGATATYGAFYPGGGGMQLGIQLLGVVSIAAWTMLTTGFLFGILKAMKKLRVPAEKEFVGMDAVSHGGYAYHLERTGADVVGEWLLRRRTTSRTKKSNNAGTNFAKAVTEAMKQDKEDNDENKNKNEPTSSNMAGEP